MSIDGDARSSEGIGMQQLEQLSRELATDKRKIRTQMWYKAKRESARDVSRKSDDARESVMAQMKTNNSCFTNLA